MVGVVVYLSILVKVVGALCGHPDLLHSRDLARASLGKLVGPTWY
jgi:hypothetical protein